MDVVTLKAVIAKLEQEVKHCHEMIRWAISEERDEKAIDMWCNSKVQAQHCLNKVQDMLDSELFDRATEAA